MFRDDLKAALTRAEQLQSDLKRADGRAEASEEEVETAVKAARFARSKESTKITYPFAFH